MHQPFPLDLHAPGAIDALIAAHRARFGDARMETDPAPAPADPAPAPAPAPPADPAPAPAPAPADPAPATWNPDAWDGKVETLPSAAQKIITDLRKEAGDERVAKKTLDAILKTINPDGGEEAPDPAALAQQLTAAQQERRSTAIELAIHKTAAQHGGNPAALTDSRAFLAKVADLDPTAEDFTQKVTDAAKAAVTENPTLKATQVVTKSGSEIPGGPGGQRKTPTTLAGAITDHYGA